MSPVVNTTAAIGAKPHLSGQTSRRDFLKISGVMGGGLVLAATVPGWAEMDPKLVGGGELNAYVQIEPDGSRDQGAPLQAMVDQQGVVGEQAEPTLRAVVGGLLVAQRPGKGMGGAGHGSGGDQGGSVEDEGASDGIGSDVEGQGHDPAGTEGSAHRGGAGHAPVGPGGEGDDPVGEGLAGSVCGGVGGLDAVGHGVPVRQRVPGRHGVQQRAACGAGALREAEAAFEVAGLVGVDGDERERRDFVVGVGRDVGV